MGRSVAANEYQQSGVVLQNQGNYTEAKLMNRRALEGMEKALEKEHLDTLTSAYRLPYSAINASAATLCRSCTNGHAIGTREDWV